MNAIRHSLLLLLVLLSACSPERRMQNKKLRAEEKANRMIARAVQQAPWLMDRARVQDTVTLFVLDTIPGQIVERTVTVVEHDTVFVDSGRVHVRLVSDADGRLRVHARCDTVFVHDTLSVTVDVPCPPHVRFSATPPCPDDTWSVPWWLVAILVVLSIALLWHVARQVLRGLTFTDPNNGS